MKKNLSCFFAGSVDMASLEMAKGETTKTKNQIKLNVIHGYSLSLSLSLYKRIISLGRNQKQQQKMVGFFVLLCCYWNYQTTNENKFHGGRKFVLDSKTTTTTTRNDDNNQN